MKLKGILNTLTSFAVASLLFACSSVDEDNRFIEIETPVAPGDSTTNIITKNVLIEDFTGQMCQNCPLAGKVIEELHGTYNDSTLIPVAIYSGKPGMCIPVGKKGSLTTDEGQEYFETWGLNNQPIGLVNRNGGPLDKSVWPAKVFEFSQQEAPLAMDVKTKLSADGKTINVHLVVTPVKSVSGKLQLWVTEDNIVGIQKMPDGKPVKDYVHNHVFRTSVNGTWGEAAQFTENAVFEKEYVVNVAEDWNAENIHIVAFVYNDVDGVLQVTRSF